MQTIRLAFRLAWAVAKSDIGKILILLVAVTWLWNTLDTERFRVTGGSFELALAAGALLMLPINLRRARARKEDAQQLKTVTFVLASVVCLMGLDRLFPGNHLNTIGGAILIGWFAVTVWFTRPSHDAAAVNNSR